MSDIFEVVVTGARALGSLFEFGQPGLKGYKFTDPATGNSFTATVTWDGAIFSDARGQALITEANLALVALGSSREFYQVATEHGPFPSDVEIVLTGFGTSTYFDGIQGMTPRVQVSTSATSREYVTKSGDFAAFSYAHALAHELMHHITGLDDRQENELHNRLTNLILRAVFPEEAERLQYAGVRWSDDAPLSDHLAEINSAFGKGHNLSGSGAEGFFADFMETFSEDVAIAISGLSQGVREVFIDPIISLVNGLTLENIRDYQAEHGKPFKFFAPEATAFDVRGHYQEVAWGGFSMPGQAPSPVDFSKFTNSLSSGFITPTQAAMFAALDIEVLNALQTNPNAARAFAEAITNAGHTAQEARDALADARGYGVGFDPTTDSEASADGSQSGNTRPIILDLDGTGIQITELNNSTVFMDANNDGLQNRIAWAGAGDGVLFYDPGGTGEITETRQFVFTEWDPTATSDIEALASVFNTNGDGVLSGTELDDFRIMVTQPDGSLVSVTLASLGITEISVVADATNIELPDGSVITGQTTFTRSDGSTGTVGDVTLAADGESYNVEQIVTIDGTGTRTEVSTGYDDDGSIAFVYTSVTSATGDQITNSYDDDGDGVVDRLQTINTVTNPDGSTTKTVTNKVGATAATAILASMMETVTSADGNTVTISRDSVGGGWFDQVEVRTTQADGSMTIVVEDRASDGSVLNKVTETVSADGLTRTEVVDRDGDGTTDLTIEHVIVVNADGSRSETITYKNGDGSLRSKVLETVSADGQTKTISRDVDGDGVYETVEELDITVNADDSTTSTIDLENADGSLRSSITHTQSDDALSETIVVDADGDGDTDSTTVDTTVINADDSRERTVTVTNGDGSTRSMVRETLGSDGVTAETWVDQNQNGSFEATDLVRSVTVDGTTQDRTEEVWDRNADGTFSSHVETVTSEDGLTSTTTVDADGDGDTDTETSDVTVVNGNGSTTQTITTKNQDGSTRSQTVIDVSADGLTRTTSIDIDGDGSNESVINDVRVLNGNGSTTQTVSTYAGDGTTLLSREVIDQSSDRRTTTSSVDTDGDGNNNHVVTSVEAADGSVTVTEITYTNDGDVTSTTIRTVSDDGLVTTLTTDADGDTINESVVTDTTVLNTDGSTTQTIVTANGDGSTRSTEEITVSDDGFTITSRTDSDGDGAYERETTETTTFGADGSTQTVSEVEAEDGSTLSRTRTTVSDDGLTTTVESDRDGDGTYDLVSETETTLNSDGSTTVDTELREAVSGTVRNATRVTTSDDGRSVTTEVDHDGDGEFDETTARIEADSGTVTTTHSRTDDLGGLQSRTQTIVDDTGLQVTERQDLDGDGTYERETSDTTTLNADGSQTRVVEHEGSDGTVYATEEVETSDDGLTVTVEEDWNNDGSIELTRTETTSLASNGVETFTSETRSADGSLIGEYERVTSADGRTITENEDFDGNGIADRIVETTVGDDGVSTVTATYYSEDGVAEASHTETTSADGLTVTRETDHNGDGFADLVVTDDTSLGSDGSVSRSVTYRDENYRSLGAEHSHVSDDGLTSENLRDFDGDGLFDYRSSSVTSHQADGSVVTIEESHDEVSNLLSRTETETSGDGLGTTVRQDYNGDGNIDRLVTREEGAEGGWSEEVREFTPGGLLDSSTTTTMSADERSWTTLQDTDGDGDTDREVNYQLNSDQEQVTTYTDYGDLGEVEMVAVSTTSANGASSEATFDFDGDGTVDLVRTVDTSFASNGDEITTTREAAENGETVYERIVTRSADGLQRVTTFDIDGDGVVDGTETSQMTLHDDGSQTESVTTLYANGDLRSEMVRETSSDRRLVTETHDYDGNGIADKTVETVINSDGETIVTERSFGEGGLPGNTFVTTTSGDGLTTTILRNDVEQRITRSAVESDSYTWDNGVEVDLNETNITVSHEVDALGIETWEMVSTVEKRVLVTSPGGDYYINETQVTTHTERLDQDAKARVLEEAARLYDTVLDRDMDFAEVEQLVEFVDDGRLDIEALAEFLIGPEVANKTGAGEFAARYDTTSDADFVTQLYLNSYGRAPTLNELSASLETLIGGQSRVSFIVEVSESVEHILTGNGHRSTNNFDVIMNPVEFERTLDEAYVQDVITNIVDVVYDRDPTAHELEHLADILLDGTGQPEDIAQALLDETGEVTDTVTCSLHDLDTAQLVGQAFINALGRDATPEELQTWSSLIDDGTISEAQFIASLAMSPEHHVTRNAHESTEAPTFNAVTGTSGSGSHNGTSGQDSLSGLDGDDTLDGGDGADIMVGGTGADSLKGGDGNDVYVWSAGDGDDTINDTGNSLLETDVLHFTDVTSQDVELKRTSGSKDLQIIVTIGGTTETILIKDLYYATLQGYGIEGIQFSDGVFWTLEDILQNTTVEGTSSSETLNGRYHDEILEGLGGNDTLNGDDGDDTLDGGLGNDSLKGGEGSDTYLWAIGDGDDTIRDEGVSVIDIDHLIFEDVTSDQVELFRDDGGDNLRIVITGPSGTEEITVWDHYDVATDGNGLEQITFSDGEEWDQSDILDATQLEGTSGNDTLNGSYRQDNINGGAGDDVLWGEGGDDVLTGGVGDDFLRGEEGNDTYIWSQGDGDDTIHDNENSDTDTDVLRLTDVASGDVTLSRDNLSDDLIITITVGGSTETITVQNQFEVNGRGRGIERIAFSDGVIWSLEEFLNFTSLTGTSSNNNLSGTDCDDNIFGLAGNDTLSGDNGNDHLIGGAGNDSLSGGSGNDAYFWSAGDGNDTINDSDKSLDDVDRLVFEDLDSTQVNLTQSGNNLLVTTSTGDQITVVNRFQDEDWGRGVELLTFQDGVTVEVLADAVATTLVTGTASNNTLNGWGFRDEMLGMDGNDTLFSKGGDDTLIGGEGNDSLRGDAGSDTYVWTTGDGNDTIYDNATSLTEIDTLRLTDVASDGVVLTRAQGSNHLQIEILATGEVIWDLHRFFDVEDGYGLEAIEFSDGVTWTFDDILANTRVEGTSGNNSLTGRDSFDENFYGLDGRDTIKAYGGDDLLVGGSGNDSLEGGDGHDTYRWEIGDGDDTIYDSGQSLTETDKIEFTDVNASDVTLRKNGDHLEIEVTHPGGTNTITISYQYWGTAKGYGIEWITFADGETWALDDLMAQAWEFGSSGNNTLQGSNYQDNLDGLAGNDTLKGYDGEDVLVGGLGNDSLEGGEGADTYRWSIGDGNDTIDDHGGSFDELDRLVLEDVSDSEVSLYRIKSTDNLMIDVGGSTLKIENVFDDATMSYGIEAIEFEDGTIWDLETILANTWLHGASSNETLNGTFLADNIDGAAGNDTIDGKAGDDVLVGGLGNDRLKGGDGSDTYRWSTGDGNDTIVDLGTSQSETDTLHLTDIGLEDVVLSKSGNDLIVTISTTGEVITVEDVYASTTNGKGIEQILCQNGEIIRINDIGTLSLDVIDSDDSHTLQGTDESDVLRGNGGNDVLNGEEGDDLLSGGADNDTLEGGLGSDTLQGDDGDDVLRGDHTNTNVEDYSGMIYRAYLAVLDREPDEAELQSGIDGLIGGQAIGDVTSNLLSSSEFQNAHGSTTDTEFVTLLYNNALNRAPDAGGLAWWSGQITNGNMTRAQVAASFSQSQEAINTSQSDLVSFMRGLGEDDRLVGGEGSDELVGGWMSDTFVFDADHTGSDSVVDLEAWDTIELHDSSFADSAAALAALVQNGSDVVLTVGNTTVTFEDVLVSEFTEDMFVFV